MITLTKRIFNRKYFSGLLFFCLVIQIFFVTPASAAVNGPGWFSESADPVSPKDAKSYYDKKRKNGTDVPFLFFPKRGVTIYGTVPTENKFFGCNVSEN